MHDGQDANSISGEVVVRKRRKGIYILPNLFTLAALFGGFYAIVMAMNGRFDQAAIGVFCAMVLDSLDGRIARMTNTQSAFGEQMDSLSDMVSFGAAPALIAYVWALTSLGRWGWIGAFVYCACAALRLGVDGLQFVQRKKSRSQQHQRLTIGRLRFCSCAQAMASS